VCDFYKIYIVSGLAVYLQHIDHCWG